MSATELHHYQPGLGENGTPGSSTGLRYAHSDPLGTLRSHTDASCAAYASFAYTAFGERVDGGAFQRHGYAGAWGYQAGDFPSGNPAPFLHVGMRWYDPAIGRFLQRDPIGITGGLNVYEYGFSHPTAGVDPSGLTWIGDAWDGAIDWVAENFWLRFHSDEWLNSPYATAEAIGLGIVGGCGIYAAGSWLLGGGESVLVTQWGGAGMRSGGWVMKGGRTVTNYVLSGKWQPGWFPGGNIYAPFSSGISAWVPASSLAWPGGWEFIKGFLGQRILM
ncbi:MAG: RHS repeat-associated core domain-containing protein [Candidatus Methylomirabilis oxygeniifera]|nr:MAG: RHS repeat-associated core domain-containing protein [Candidatus Methylomirabilis oxyfera]